jgi:type IV pilus assembly protein PilO
MMHYDVRQIYDWPQTPRAIVIIIICLIVFYLGYFFDLSTLNSRLSAIQQNEQDLKAQLASLASKQAEIKAELEKYSILENTLIETQKKLISSKELPELLNEILKIGTQNGLEFIDFTPGNEEKDKINPYLKVGIKVVVVGTYDQIATFISQVANISHIVAIGDFTIARPSSEKLTAEQASLVNRLTADLTLEVYEAKRP